MSRFVLPVVVAAIALVRPASAQDGYIPSLEERLEKRRHYTPEEVAAENACALAATAILTGVVVGDPKENLALCNKHPDRESCLETKRFVEGSGKAAQDLTCR